jgi:class 3 adenylate cyclase/tetratricopeptide (TPR) repeat protein
MIGCHRCGGRSRAGARFCGACGTALGSSRAGVRKTVTVLFAHAPELTGGHDLESRVRLAHAFYEAVKDVITAHGGTVERSAGDAVMAVFGVPTARDDDARRAADAALALQAADLPGSPSLAIGINTGEVLAGSADGEQELAVGDPVVVAARLQQQAGPGEILLGPATLAMLGPEARVGQERDVALKGRSGALSVVPLLGLDAPVERGPRGPFIGRDAEKRMLLAALDRTLTGGIVQFVTVLGEPGTGKSRLVEEVVSMRADQATILTTTCTAYGAGSAWGPLIVAAEQYMGVPRGSSADLLLGASAERSEFSGGLPVLASLVGREGGQVTRADLTAAITRLLEKVARKKPLVVVTEDVHLADNAMTALVKDVMRRLDGVPVMAICTGRPELLDVRPDWGQGLRHVVGITVRPLPEEQARQLAQYLLPGDPEGVERIVGVAGGNPLFLEQLAQAHREGTGAPAPSVAAVLTARLDRLPLETRQVLERAAIVGPSGKVSDLAPLCDGEQAMDLDVELAALARRDLLDVADGRFVFASELVREAALKGLTRDDKAELHQVRGVVLAAQGANAAAGFHLEQASTLFRQSDPERAAALAKQAGARLAAAGLLSMSGDLVAAADLLSRATALMPPDGARRLALLPELARALMLSGDLGGAADVLDEAVRRAEAVGNASVAAHARLARIDLQGSTDPEQAYASLDETLAEVMPVLLASGDDHGLSLAFQLEAARLEYSLRWAAMEAPLEKALHHAERAGDRRLVELAQALQVDSIFYGPMHLDETRHRLAAMLERPGTSPSHRASVEARLAATVALQGDPQAARAALSQVRRVFRDLGREVSALATAVLGGPVEMLAGDPERAVALLREASEAFVKLGDKACASALAAHLAEACWRCQDTVGAEDAVGLARDTAGSGDAISQVRWRSVAAKLHAAEGRAEEALALSAEAIRLVNTTDELVSRGDVLADAAAVQELLGNPGAAQELLREAVQRYDRKGAVQSIRLLAPRLIVPPALRLPIASARVGMAGA